MAEASVAVVGCGYWGKNLVRNMHALGALRMVVESQTAAHAKVKELAPGVPVVAAFGEALFETIVGNFLRFARSFRTLPVRPRRDHHTVAG